MRDTVVILGSHPRTRAEFDFTRTDCDLWVFNEALSNNTFSRAEAVFQMHEEAIWRNPANRNDPKHYDWLKAPKTAAVYMQDEYPDIPNSVRFPLEEISQRFQIRYFTSSVAYAIALACYMDYKRIEIYGVEMETNTEYQYQRDGVTLWVGVALGLGIEVDAHMTIFDQPLYGYEGEVVMKYEVITDRIAELSPQVDAANTEYMAAVVNVQQAIDAFAKDAGKENEDRLFAVVGRQVELGTQLGHLDGAKQENERYQKKADTMRAASGEFLFSRQEFESAAAKLKEVAEKTNTEFISVGTTLQHIHDNLKRAAKNSPKHKRLLAAFLQHVQKYLQTNNKLSVYQGAAGENFRYMAYLDKHIRAAGGTKSEAVLLERLQENVPA